MDAVNRTACPFAAGAIRATWRRASLTGLALALPLCVGFEASAKESPALRCETAADLPLPKCFGSPDLLMKCPSGTALMLPRGKLMASAACYLPRKRPSDRRIRQGPAVYYHTSKGRPTSKIRAVGHYKNHDKTGRWYYFDRKGRLARIVHYANDNYHGQYIQCTRDGKVQTLMYYRDGKLDGLMRSWKPDGTLSTASWYKAGKRQPITDPAARQKVAKRPEGLCRPVKCDITAKSPSPTASQR